MDGTWQTHAQRRGDTYHYFGPPDWAGQFAGDGVAAVELVEDDQGEYYGWLDRGERDHGPVCVALGYEAMLRMFRAGGSDDEDPYADQAAGRGRVIRLRVREQHPAGTR